MSNKLYKFSVELEDYVKRAIRSEMLPKLVISAKESKLELMSTIAKSAREVIDLGLVVNKNRSIFTKKAMQIGGFPQAGIKQSDIVLRVLRNGYMIQMNWNPVYGFFEDVLFLWGNTLYYYTTKEVGLFFFTFNKGNKGTDAWENLKNWSRVKCSFKSGVDSYFYLIANINNGVSHKCRETLDGKKCEEYNIFNNGTIAVRLYRLIYFVTHLCNDETFKLLSQGTVNHMLANTDMYDEVFRKSLHFGDAFDDYRRTFASFVCNPMFLEVCTPQENTRHGKFVSDYGLRCIPVSVDCLHDSEEEFAQRILDGVTMLEAAIDSLLFGHEIKRDMMAICYSHLASKYNIF